MRMNDAGFGVSRVLEGMAAAVEAGLGPIKVNAVIRRGINEHAICDLAEHFRGTGITVRFIEFMDVGHTNGWRLDDVVPATDIIDRLETRWLLEPLEPTHPGEVARRYRYRDGGGEVGVISSVTQPFCGDCSRARLSADGSHPVQRAWVELDVPQCGYCQAGQIMSASSLLSRTPRPTDQDIDRAMNGNICRCATYHRIRAAIHRAAQMAAADGGGGRRGQDDAPKSLLPSPAGA